MKKKLIAALKTKFADKGFNQAEMEGLADILAKTLSDEATEEDISNAVGGAADYVEMMQKIGNRYASQVENKYKGYVKPETDPDPEPNGGNGITLEQVSGLLSAKIAEAIKPFKDAEQAQKLSSILASQPQLKNIPAKFVSRYKLEREEDAQALAARIEQEFAEERKEMLSSLGLPDVPFNGNGGVDTDDDFAKMMQEAQKALAKD